MPSQHVVLGGKNFLKLLVFNRDQLGLLADINLVDPNPSLRLQLIPKLFNVNTIKCNADLIACGLTNGTVHIFQVAGNGKSKLTNRLDDHKRVVNSLDFVEMDLLLFSGSQDGSVRLWDLRLYSPKPVIKLLASQHSDPVRSCQFSPYSKVRGKLSVLSVHDSGSLCKFDLRYPPSSTSKSVFPERKWTFHTGPALSLHIHPEMEYVLTGGRDRKICLWNYSDSMATSKAPELIMNTYGPVMKIRWRDSPNSENPPMLLGNMNYEPEGRSSALYNYDFACLFLNDDPTVAVYNLARRYVPKEIITSGSRKPIQNFSWAKGVKGERRLWTISKANNFVSYDLDSPTDLLPNILRTHENLPVVATAWSEGYANMAFINQKSEDYALNQLSQDPTPFEDALPQEEYRIEDDKFHISKSFTNIAENVNLFSRSFLSSAQPHPLNPAFISPKEKVHSSRQNSMLPSVPNSPSPVSFHHPSVTEFSATVSPVQPLMKRTPSQSTIESFSLATAFVHPLATHGVLGLNKSSKPSILVTPSVIALNVPIPLADEAIFASLAANYLIKIPDGFSISFVCGVNAQMADRVGRQRDSQTWSLLGAILDQERPELADSVSTLNLTKNLVLEDLEKSKLNDDMKSLCSELDNFVASYNSNSTLTTNYGGGPRSNASTTSMTRALISSSKQSSNLVEFIDDSKKLSKALSATTHDKSEQDFETKGEPKDNDSVHLRPSKETPSLFIGDAPSGELAGDDIDEEPAIKEEDSEKQHPKDNDSAEANVRRNRSLLDIKLSQTLHAITNPFANESKFVSPDFMGEDQSPQSRARKPNMRRGFSFTSPTGFQKIPLLNNLYSDRSSAVPTHFGVSPGSVGNSVSLENHNMSVLRNLVNQSRVYQYLSTHSDSSVGSLAAPLVDGFIPVKENEKATASGLDRVDEGSIKSKDYVPSELTKAMIKVNLGNLKTQNRLPWYSLNLISKALNFAIDEGDLITASTFIMLFADLYTDEFYTSVLTEVQCLECLGAYVEALRKKELYNAAAHIVKDAPRDLKYRLSLYAFKEVDMKFYCCWCQKLLVNEQSKSRVGASSENYGYWYCDECARKQLNCVYCNEPCKGLTVVVDLDCGHRGHFGCLKEWFIEDKNKACPGGCEK